MSKIEITHINDLKFNRENGMLEGYIEVNYSENNEVETRLLDVTKLPKDYQLWVSGTFMNIEDGLNSTLNK